MGSFVFQLDGYHWVFVCSSLIAVVMILWLLRALSWRRKFLLQAKLCASIRVQKFRVLCENPKPNLFVATRQYISLIARIESIALY